MNVQVCEWQNLHGGCRKCTGGGQRGNLHHRLVVCLFTLQQENLFRQTDSLSPAHTIAWANVAITGCTDCFYKQSNVLIAPQCHSVYIFLGNQPINSVCIVVCVYQLWKKKAEMTCLFFFFFFFFVAPVAVFAYLSETTWPEKISL